MAAYDGITDFLKIAPQRVRDAQNSLSAPQSAHDSKERGHTPGKNADRSKE